MMPTMPMLAPSHTQNNSEAVPCRWSSVTDSMPAVSTDQGRSAAGCSGRWRVRGDMVKGSPLHLRRFDERFSYPQGRSPGCRLDALSRLPRPAAQWHIGEDSPVTVAGPRRILTGFPILPHRPSPCDGTRSVGTPCDVAPRLAGSCQFHPGALGSVGIGAPSRLDRSTVRGRHEDDTAHAPCRLTPRTGQTPT